MQSLVEFRGILKEQPYQDLPNGAVPEAYVRQNFRFEHEAEEQLGEFINAALQEIVKLGGMVIHKKEPHKRFDFNNQTYIPTHMFSRIDLYVKRITENIIDHQVSDVVEPKPEALN